MTNYETRKKLVEEQSQKLEQDFLKAIANNTKYVEYENYSIYPELEEQLRRNGYKVNNLLHYDYRCYDSRCNSVSILIPHYRFKKPDSDSESEKESDPK